MNLKEGSAAINEQRIAFYDANKAVIAAPYWKDTGTNTMSGGYLASLTVPALFRQDSGLCAIRMLLDRFAFDHYGK